MPRKNGKAAQPKVEVQQPTTPKFDYDPVTVATIAASLMPRMTIQENRKNPDLLMLRRQLDWERNPYTFTGTLKADGTSVLDMLMEEAICRARLLLGRAAGEESPARIRHAKLFGKDAAKQSMLDRVTMFAAEWTTAIPWQVFAEWVLPHVSPNMREQCWRRTSTVFLHLRQLDWESERDEIVWASEAKPKDKKNPTVLIVPDNEIPQFVDLAGVWQYAGVLYDSYQEEGPKLRQRLSREKGKQGGEKAQRQRKKAAPWG